MFAFLTASALSEELQIGNHIIDVYQPIERTFPSATNGKYVYITQDLFSHNPTLEVRESGYKLSLNPAKGSAVHYSLFKIPENAVVVLNEMSHNTWTIEAGQTVIAVFNTPVSCQVKGNNLLTSTAGFDLTGSGTETDPYFFGSQIIAIKNSGSSAATANFSFAANTESKGTYYTDSKYKITFPSTQNNYAIPTQENVQIYHPGVYSASSIETLKVNINNGYSLKCLQCTGDTGSNPFTLSKQSNTDAISFLVYKKSDDDIVLIPGTNDTKYIWNTYDKGNHQYSQKDSKTYYFVSDSPFMLTYSRTSGTEVAFADTFDTTSPTFVSITETNAVSIYGQFIGLQIKGEGVFFSKMSADFKQNIQSITAPTTGDIQTTDKDCTIIGKSGLSTYNLAASSLLVIPSGYNVYYSKTTENNFNSPNNIQTTITDQGEYYICAYNTADTTVVTGNPTNTIFSKNDTKKILFISGSQALSSSFRSLREGAGKSITYYSSSTARIDVLPLNANINLALTKIENAVAVYLEDNDPDQLAFGFTESSGYDGTTEVHSTRTIKALTNPKIIAENFYYTTIAVDKGKDINLIPISSKKNVLVLMNYEKFGLSAPVIAFTTIQKITPQDENLIYGVTLLDKNIDRISLVINPPQYTRMTVPQGNCAIIAISSNPFRITYPSGIQADKVNDKFQTFTGSDAYIDFITGTGDTQYKNLDDSKPALENYDPTWNPSDNYNGTIIKEGRYDFKLTSTVQTVTASTNTIVFFVPKSMDKKVVINVINPVDGTKDVRKLDLFKNKTLGYYFDTALNIELSGESNLEIYVYKLSITPSSFEGIVFKRGGSEITSKSLGFIGFSNYSLCAVSSPPSGLIGYDANPLTGSQIFTDKPFYVTKESTFKYELKRSDTNDPKEEEFTIPTSDNLKGGISAASLHRQEGELVKYEPDSGLTKGQVAGIVVAIILFIIIDIAIVVLVCYCRKHEPKPQFNFEEEEDALEGDIGADPDGGDVQAGPDVPEDAPAEEEPAKE